MSRKFVDNWITQFKKTLLPLLILNMLKQESLYGYMLINRIKDNTGLDISEGAIYPILNRLKEDGLINSKWVEQKTGIPRKYYELTIDGEGLLKELNQNWHAVVGDISKQII